MQYVIRAITNSNKLSTVSEVAGLFDIGRNTMYKWLREKGIVQTNINKPYQRYIDSGHFKYKLDEVNRELYYTTLITGKGLTLIGKLMQE